jgi:hypothetical protein
MQVIRQGINPVDVKLQAECSNCTAIIEFRPREVQRIPDQRDGDFYQFNCPCCGKNVTKACGRGYFGPG